MPFATPKDEAERDAALLALDVAWFQAKLKGTPFSGADDATMLVQMHNARVEHVGLPALVRALSWQWLKDNGKDTAVNLRPVKP